MICKETEPTICGTPKAFVEIFRTLDNTILKTVDLVPPSLTRAMEETESLTDLPRPALVERTRIGPRLPHCTAGPFTF